MVTRQVLPTDPIMFLDLHLAANSYPYNVQLFVFTSLTRLKCLTRKVFLEKCKKIWGRLGIQWLKNVWMFGTCAKIYK